MTNQHLKIGILNLMHDKVATQQRFSSIFKALDSTVELTFFYPVDHYRNRPVPELVQQTSEPLDLNKVSQLQGFIITGAPIEQIPFEQVEYHDEVTRLIDTLVDLNIPQLYICWGAMAAANYLYGIEKRQLTQKYFGVFDNEILVETPVLNGLTVPFPAPHARYAELDHDQIRQTPELTINAMSCDNYLLSLTGSDNQDFLFAHLEYDRLALLAEYQRETAAHPDRHYTLPKNYFKDSNKLTDPQFKWEKVQQLYFKNWLQKTAEYSQNALTIA
ncbi:homoserine O-acetyltransferase/O-succinyltransferase family protein [Limosilactobacillus mucosae]|uniref:homoserine O-acetyltransferase/O-succinyltransferase family protein n=1 Tax=Limosilactobacillus mucosae TaxID=97478 RepID=UPI003992D96A